MNLLLELTDERWAALLNLMPYRAVATFSGGIVTLRCRFCGGGRYIVVERRLLREAKNRVRDFAYRHQECARSGAAERAGLTRCCR